jgi:hypothetical protein
VLIGSKFPLVSSMNGVGIPEIVLSVDFGGFEVLLMPFWCCLGCNMHRVRAECTAASFLMLFCCYVPLFCAAARFYFLLLCCFFFCL